MLKKILLIMGVAGGIGFLLQSQGMLNLDFIESKLDLSLLKIKGADPSSTISLYPDEILVDHVNDDLDDWIDLYELKDYRSNGARLVVTDNEGYALEFEFMDSLDLKRFQMQLDGVLKNIEE